MAHTTTGQQVFELAMGLVDEINANSGIPDPSDTKEYKQRALYILNVLRGELYQISDTYNDPKQTEGKRPVCALLTSLEDVIDLDDFVAQTIMPYGLASHLMLQEDTTSAAFLQSRYEELKMKYGTAIPCNGSESIDNVYGCEGFAIEYGWFSRW